MNSVRKSDFLALGLAALLAVWAAWEITAESRDAPVQKLDPLAGLRALSENSDPHPAIAPYARRVFYNGHGSRAWGTFCRWREGWVTADHVQANGSPVLGPDARVTFQSASVDFSFHGVNPSVKPDTISAPVKGRDVFLVGFPARDRDGEVIAGRLHTDDVERPGWWVELRDAASDEWGAVDAEGVVGGVSGGCVIDASDGALIGVVVANSFSRIEGTTNTFARFIPLRDMLRIAQGGSVDPVGFANIVRRGAVPAVEPGGME